MDRHPTFEKAVDAAMLDENIGGITLEKGGYTLRVNRTPILTTLKKVDTALASWVKPVSAAMGTD